MNYFSLLPNLDVNIDNSKNLIKMNLDYILKEVNPKNIHSNDFQIKSQGINIKKEESIKEEIIEQKEEEKEQKEKTNNVINIMQYNNYLAQLYSKEQELKQKEKILDTIINEISQKSIDLNLKEQEENLINFINYILKEAYPILNNMLERKQIQQILKESIKNNPNLNFNIHTKPEHTHTINNFFKNKDINIKIITNSQILKDEDLIIKVEESYLKYEPKKFLKSIHKVLKEEIRNEQ